jgi:multisubunit Na+/H+ antiporter MnhC subunit
METRQAIYRATVTTVGAGIYLSVDRSHFMLVVDAEPPDIVRSAIYRATVTTVGAGIYLSVDRSHFMLVVDAEPPVIVRSTQRQNLNQ